MLFILPQHTLFFCCPKNVQSELLFKYAAIVCGTYGLEMSDMTENFLHGGEICRLLHYNYRHVVDLGDVMTPKAIEMDMSDKQYEAELEGR